MEKVIFDVDGTLMDIEHRRHFVSGAMNDWKSFLDPKVMKGDSPKWEVVNTAVALHNSGVEIVVVSARNERHREVTEAQLSAAGVKFQHLFLRPDDDFRSDVEFKSEVFDQLVKADWTPDLVFDDRNSVVAMWRAKGVPCFQVADGDF